MISFDVGKRLRSVRQRKGFSIRGLARLAECSASGIAQIEANGASPTISVLEKICAALGISLAEFLDEDPQLPHTMTLTLDEKELPLAMLWQGVRIRHLLPAGVPNAFTALLVTFEPGVETPLRCSNRSINELAIVLEGELEFTVGSKTFTLQRDMAIYFGMSEQHKIRNAGHSVAKAVMTHGHAFRLIEQEEEKLIWSQHRNKARLFR